MEFRHRRRCRVYFGFCHQGAKLFSAKMCLCIWTQCVLTHSVLTHCVRTQCGAQKCLAYKKKLAKSTFAICSLCCKVLQLYGSLCSLWGGRKSLFLFSPNFRALLICRLSFYVTRLNVLCASNVDLRVQGPTRSQHCVPEVVLFFGILR